MIRISENEQELMDVLQEFYDANGVIPTREELRKDGISEKSFVKVFGSYGKAKEHFQKILDEEKEKFIEKKLDAFWKAEPTLKESLVTYFNTRTTETLNNDDTKFTIPASPSPFIPSYTNAFIDSSKIVSGVIEVKKSDIWNIKRESLINTQTTLVIPDPHVGPNQYLSRFISLNKLILNKKPDNIISMGDFLTLESLSNWDLGKAGLMENRRYVSDIESGKQTLTYLLKDVDYKPNLIFLVGNHENRIDRYLESYPHLKDHINLEKDLNLRGFGFDTIIPYKEFYEIEGTMFTHAPMNAANQAIGGKYGMFRVSEMMGKSIVYAHTHRKESINYNRHGSDINQVLNCGCFFEHVDNYAKGSLHHYWRGCMILTHWDYGRFDVEEFSIERLKREY